MNETTETNKAYERLTPQRKAPVDHVIKNLETSNGLWTQGCVGSGVPESAVTGKKYHGVNNFYMDFQEGEEFPTRELSFAIPFADALKYRKKRDDMLRKINILKLK